MALARVPPRARPVELLAWLSSTCCPPCCWWSPSSCRCSCSRSYFITQADERQGHHAVAAQPPARRAHRTCSRSSAQEGVARGQPRRSPGDADRQGQRERAPDRAARRCRRQDRRRRGQGQRARRPSSTSRRRSPTRRWPRSRCSTSSSRRSGSSSPPCRKRSMPPRPRTRTARPRSPISASGSTWRSPRRCRSCPLPLRLLRQAAGGSRRPRRFPGRRRPLRVPVRRAVRLRLGRSRSRRPRAQLDKLADALKQLETQDPARHRLGDAGRRPYRHPADRHARISRRTGSCRAARAISVVRYLIEHGIAGEPAGRGGLRRIPADRPGDQRRSLGQEPPHRAEAHRALDHSAASGANCSSARRA